MRLPIMKVESTWAICTTAPPTGTPRLMVSPVASLSAAIVECASRASHSRVSVRAAYCSKSGPGR
ncbi:MAG: hypothetical protein DI571_14565 [Arsenicicoccus sp.]|nr:MAG: hypothetical protein DI571_14565 [Arsenicicoccus sp.]